jgi:hypothetical protein
VEEALFASSTNGFLGFATLLPTDGQGTVGGIDAGTETWWRNYASTYLDDGTDIDAALISAFDAAAKGSGSALAPTCVFSGATPHALFEASQVALRRYIDSASADLGYKVLAVKTARYVFSQHGGDLIYGVNKTSFQVKVFKGAFRQMGETVEIPNANAFVRKIYTACQTVTNNKSRGFVLDVTSSS